MKLKYTILATSLLGMVAANGAITWGTAQTITGDASVSETGVFHSAFSAGAGATVGTNVFSGGANFWGNGNVDASADYYQGAGSAALHTVLDAQNWDASATAQTLTLTGLSENTSYQIQAFMTDSRGGGVGARAQTVAMGDGTGDQTGASTDPGTPTFFIGTFSTGAGETTVDMQAFNTADTGGFLNAVSIRTVPEPSSAALLGLGGLALIMRRRK